MKLFVALAVLALVAVSHARPADEAETLSAAPNAEVNKELVAAAPVAAAPADGGKDLDTANSYIYGGYGYPYGYGGGYGLGYAAYPYYGGYGGYGLGYGGYPYYGGYYY